MSLEAQLRSWTLQSNNPDTLVLAYLTSFVLCLSSCYRLSCILPNAQVKDMLKSSWLEPQNMI